jgi:hypothetical protein
MRSGKFLGHILKYNACHASIFIFPAGKSSADRSPGSTGDPPVLSGNLPDSICDLEESVGKLPTETGKLPVLPEARI